MCMRIMKIYPLFLLALFCFHCTNVNAQSLVSRARIYACTTVDGRKLTSDQPIKECVNREQRIIASNGALIGIIPPQLTARQQELLIKEKERQQQILKQEQERRKMDQQYHRTLFEKYSTPQAHATARQNALQSLQKKIDAVKAKRVALLKQQYELKIERDAYSDVQQIPPELTKSSQKVDNDIIVQDRLLEELTQQVKEVNINFDAEKQILLPYWKQLSSPK